MKKAMTKTMTESLTIPFFTFSDEIDATALIALRKEMKKVHTNLTMLPFFIKAISIAMTEYPLMNSHIDNDLDGEGFIQRYVIKHDHNYSVAIDSPDGLTVPNIKGIQDLSILGINVALKDLSVRASNGGLTKADFDDGTFSVSSVGNIGGRYFVPTILRPQAAIIAIG
jgi:2-oxoisovalerate dehydrogenase E2 component (dihydrolipoyl transacylase)